MAIYILLGIITMFAIESGSPYPWKFFERILIVLLWPIALAIVIRALILRIFYDE